MTSSALSRFLRYVTFDTRSDEQSATVPSTPGQLVLSRELVAELRALGLKDAAMDEHGYVMATIPATVGREDTPAIGFIAHVDTSPEMPGDGVKPIVHRRYDGRDLILPDDLGAVLRAADNPALASQIGHDIVTASGLTLLGADDKAGVAEIVAAAEQLMTHPEIPHGRVRIAFTPDEEIGRGANQFRRDAFRGVLRITLDAAGARIGVRELSADAITVTFQGASTHFQVTPRARMVNAIRVRGLCRTVCRATRFRRRRNEGYEGYLHPYQITGVGRHRTA
jgi:tripeptide aminopeptidase